MADDDAVRKSAHDLMPLFYDEVRRLARRERRAVGAGATLQTTALIHEAYLRLKDKDDFKDRTHFLRSAALAMRHALINHARDRLTKKRGSGAQALPLEAADQVPLEQEQMLLDVHDALVALASFSPRLAQVVECRFFAGYDDVETAEALNLSDRTVRREWIKARAWLRVELDLG